MKMKRIYIISSILFSILFLTSCGDDSNSPNNVSNKTFPLSLGNYWVFEAQVYDHENNVEKTETDSLVCVETSQLNEKTAYLMEYYQNAILKDSIYLSQENDKLYLFLDENKMETKEFNSDWVVLSKDILLSEELTKIHTETKENLVDTLFVENDPTKNGYIFTGFQKYILTMSQRDSSSADKEHYISRFRFDNAQVFTKLDTFMYYDENKDIWVQDTATLQFIESNTRDTYYQHRSDIGFEIIDFRPHSVKYQCKKEEFQYDEKDFVSGRRLTLIRSNIK